MIRLLRALFAGGVLLIPFAVGSSAIAQVCTSLDPTCIVEETVETAEDTVGSVEGAADDTAGTAREAVDDAVSKVRGVADDGVSTVRDTVDGILNNGGTPPPGGGGGSDPGNGGGTPGRGSDHGDDGGRQHRDAGSGRSGGPPHTVPAGGGSPTTASDPGSLGIPPNDVVSDPSEAGTAPTITRVVASVIGGVALMALLLGAVAAFLTVQDRLDRRDPKLMPVPLGSDRVQFA